jgi:hypothetical protein
VIALDTNLLVYAHRARTPEHRAARAALDRAAAIGTEWGVAYPCLLEFWAVVTHPAAAPRPSTPREASAFLAGLVEAGGLSVWIPRAGFWQRLHRIAVDLGVAGPRIFDLQIALISFESGATDLWTHDVGFVSVPGLPVSDPLAGGNK